MGSPTGWADKLTNSGTAIQWTTTSNDLVAGGTLPGFNFESTETPGQLLLNYAGSGTGAGDPVTTSFVYIGAPLGDPGAEFVATPAATAATPEPESLVLTLTGVSLLAGAYTGRRRKLRAA